MRRTTPITSTILPARLTSAVCLTEYLARIGRRFLPRSRRATVSGLLPRGSGQDDVSWSHLDASGTSHNTVELLFGELLFSSTCCARVYYFVFMGLSFLSFVFCPVGYQYALPSRVSHAFSIVSVSSPFLRGDMPFLKDRAPPSRVHPLPHRGRAVAGIVEVGHSASGFSEGTRRNVTSPHGASSTWMGRHCVRPQRTLRRGRRLRRTQLRGNGVHQTGPASFRSNLHVR